MKVSEYKTVVFDCDGVILDSNKIKTMAFYEAVIHFGSEPAKLLVEYHIDNGGISRFKKFEWFADNFISDDDYDISVLLSNYAKNVEDGLLSCKIAQGLAELRMKTNNSGWLVASGGAQSELRNVFKQRQLDSLFDSGIFGSPDPKDVIINREISNGNIVFPALFIGDSRYDYEVASSAGMDFVFANYWTEFKAWEEYFEDKTVKVVSSLKDLL